MTLHNLVIFHPPKKSFIYNELYSKCILPRVKYLSNDKIDTNWYTCTKHNVQTQNGSTCTNFHLFYFAWMNLFYSIL